MEKFQIQSATDHVEENSLKKLLIINNIRFVSGQIVKLIHLTYLKILLTRSRTSSENTVMVIGSEIGGKASILVTVSDDLVKGKNISAVAIIKEISG